MSDSLIPEGRLSPAEIHSLREKYTAEAKFTLTRSDAALTDAERTRLDALEEALRELDLLAEQAAEIRTATENFKAGAYESTDPPAERGGLQFMAARRDPWKTEAERMTAPEVRAAALVAMERMAGDDAAREAAHKIVERQSPTTPNGEMVARWALVASNPDYASAFERVLRDPVRGHLSWNAQEQAAYRAVAEMEQRIGSTSTGSLGWAIPTHLDPSFIMDSVGVSHPFRQIARVEQLADGGTWNGVTTAGTSLTFSTEGAEVGDGTPTLGRAGIPVFRQHGWISGSFEAIDDVPNLSSEVGRLFVDATEVSESAAFTNGNGTTAPQGIVTALMAESSRWSAHATNSTFVATDVMRAQEHLGARWQKNASWIGSLTYQNRVRAMGDEYSSRTVMLNQPVSSEILGRPAYEASNMSTALSTITNTAFVYGDFNNYVIVDRIGSRVDFIPHLMGASGRPSGQAGWYLYRRVGAEAVTTTSFVMSYNPGA